MLGMEGREVTVIDQIPVEEFGAVLAVFNRIEIMYQLEKYGVNLVGDRRIESFTDEGVVTMDSAGGEHLIRGDSYVLALGVYPDDSLANELRSKFAADVYVVGDCAGTGRVIADACQEAFYAAIRISSR